MNIDRVNPDLYRFSTSVPIRYADIDAQGHLNNAAYFGFMEHARVEYLQEVGLWSGDDFETIGVILASTCCAYRSPAFLGETVRVWARASHLGTKSFRFEYRLEAGLSRGEGSLAGMGGGSGRILAQGESVQVCYDYAREESMVLPGEWREALLGYEPGLADTGPQAPKRKVAAQEAARKGADNFHFVVRLPIRYADIDAQRHLNNVAYLRFMEHAQVLYLRELGLWKGQDYTEIGMIVAEAACEYRAPAYLGETVSVWTRVCQLGSKSFHFEYRLEVERSGGPVEIARVRSVQVCYDYERRRSIPMPDGWREVITAYEEV